MWIKRTLGKIRRVAYGLYDEFLYKGWLKSSTREQRSIILPEWQPTISIIVPVYNTDHLFFDKMVQSVMQQTYKNWELVLVDDKSPDQTIRNKIKQYALQDSRIKYLFLKTNHHIARATNEGIKIAKGDFIGLLDHDDVLCPNALEEVAKALNKNKKLEFIYTDEDKIIGNRRIQPFFKPDLNVDLLHSVNYITHFSVIRKTTLDRVGYEKHEYNGAQDWELFLRVIRNIPRENVYHIREILYSWRVHELSTSKDMGVKPYVLDSQEKAIRDDLEARGETDYELVINPRYSGQWKLAYKPIRAGEILQVTDLRDVTGSQLRRSKFIAVVHGEVSKEKQIIARKLADDAARKEIGIVIAGSRSVISNNLKVLLGKECVGLIKNFTHVSISKHLYRTTRYNLPAVVDYSIAVIETKKIKNIALQDDVSTLSRHLAGEGLQHLHIPYGDLV